jgi:hypothetical protein
MAAHKVPQDVEADDKFLGPLSFKQFLFFGGFAICGYLSFLTITRVWPVSFIFILPMLAFGILAFPWSKEQPTELFLASRIRFLIKPRKRIWDQSGVKDLVNITAPIREVHLYSDGLSQGEVRNRLSALATMVDSRGWAIKNVNPVDAASDRLVQAPAQIDVNAALVNSATDVFDESAGTIASQFDNMIEQSEKQHKSETMQLIEEARRKTSAQADSFGQPVDKSKVKNDNQNSNQDFWFMHAPDQPTVPGLATFQSSTVVTPKTAKPIQSQTVNNSAPTDLTEEELLKTVHEKRRRDALQTMSHHEKIINPDGSVTTPTTPETDLISEQVSQATNQSTNTMTTPVDPVILSLAQDNNLYVETLSREVNQKKDFGDDEVVVSLH